MCIKLSFENKSELNKILVNLQVKNVIVNATVEMVTFELDDELRPGEEYYFQVRSISRL